MALRTNLNTNPACKNDATGWFGGGRTTGITGLSRTTGYLTTLTDSQPPRIDITPGDTYRFSAEVKGSGGASSGTCNINWYLDGAYVSSAPAQAWSVSSGGTTRVDSLAQTAPGSGVNQALLTIEGIDNPIQITAVLYEETSDLDDYFDGDTANATWLGADGNSESQLDDGLAVFPDGIADATAFGTATVSQHVVGSGIADATAFGSAVVTIGQTLAAFGVASGQAVGTPLVDIFPALIQHAWHFISSTTLSKSAPFPSQLATAGNVIVFVMIGNRDIGTLTLAGSGWHYTVNLRHNRLSLVIAWKVAAGGESGVNASWTSGNDSGSQCWVAEYSSTLGGDWVVKGSASTNTDGTNQVDVSTGTTGTLIGQGVGIAAFGVENVLSDSTDSVNNGYALLVNQGGGVYETGIWVATKSVPALATTTATLSRTSPVTASPMSAGVVVLGKATPATLLPSGIATGEAFGSLSILALYPTGIASGQALGSPTVAITTFTISPSGVSTGEAFGTHVVHRGPLILVSGIADTGGFGTASVDYPARDVWLGAVHPTTFYLGDTEVDVLFLGSNRVWN